MMGRPNVLILVPVVIFLLFINDGVKGRTKETVTVSRNITNATKASNNDTKLTTKVPTSKTFSKTSSKTSKNVSLTSTRPFYTRPVQLGPMVKRLAIVALALSLIVALYFVWKLCGSRKRKARKYGIVKTPGDVELRPLEGDDDDDDDEDITMFNRKN